jgi:hypothetical protein
MSQPRTDNLTNNIFNLDIQPRTHEEIDNLTNNIFNLNIQPRTHEEIVNSMNYAFNLDIQPRTHVDNLTNNFFNLLRTDEEIVNSTNYNFNLDINALLDTSTRTRRAKRLQRLQRTCSTPRPQKPFMLYRRDKAAGLKFVGLKSSEISKRIGELWKNETAEVIVLFNALARLTVKRHIEKYECPYRYCPKPSQNRSIRNRENLLSRL